MSETVEKEEEDVGRASIRTAQEAAAAEDDETYVTDTELVDALGRKGLYTGPTTVVGSRVLPHGDSGKMVYYYDNNTNNNDGVSCYTGSWKYGHFQGQGQLEIKQGDGAVVVTTTMTYCGEFVQSQKHGHGQYTWHNDGRSYTGAYQHDQRHGIGTYQWNDGSRYEGSFCDNQRHGFGKYSSDTIQYTGEWQQGHYHGQGEYKTAAAAQTCYRGEFQAGLPHGRGIEYSNDGTVRHHGLWNHGEPVVIADEFIEERKVPSASSSNSNKNDPSLQVVTDRLYFDSGIAVQYRGLWDTHRQEPHGHGVAVYKQGDIVNYEGCWQAGRYHGHGRTLYNNGDVYEGEFAHGIKQGMGTYKWSDGRQYAGDYVDNQRTGAGVFTYPNSDRYEGEFQNGQRSGQGTFVFAKTGAYYTGEWQNGQYHGTGTAVDENGATVTGQFDSGELHGLAKELDANGKLLFEGQWIRGVKQDGIQNKKPPPMLSSSKNSNSNTMTNPSTMPPRPLSPNAQPLPLPEASSPNNNNNYHCCPPPAAAPPPPPVEAGTTLYRTWEQQQQQQQQQEECVAVVDCPVTDRLQCNGRYTGIVLKRTQQPHGVGRLVYADGKRIHEGFWVDGSKEGHGRCMFFPQQDFHEGEYHNNLRHGPGRYQWKNGRRYVGMYQHDFRHGHGVFTYPNGERYEGNFEKGQRSGFGRFDFVETKSNGTGVTMGQYEGEWKAGKYHGNGRIVWGSTGHVYEGEFVEGYMHGRGVKKDETGAVLQEGVWVRGSFQKEEEDANTTPPAVLQDHVYDDEEEAPRNVPVLQVDTTTTELSGHAIPRESEDDDDVNLLSLEAVALE